MLVGEEPYVYDRPPLKGSYAAKSRQELFFDPESFFGPSDNTPSGTAVKRLIYSNQRAHQR
jgi:hypothetical protein